MARTRVGRWRFYFVGDASLLEMDRLGDARAGAGREAVEAWKDETLSQQA